jgi:hypothetical protein
MAPYSLKAGLRKFRKQGEVTGMKELGQIHDMSVFVPIDPAKLTQQQMMTAFVLLIFVKQKTMEL